MTEPWSIVVAIVLVGGVCLAGIGKDILRTLKRIDARLALASPLEEEQKVFEEPRGFLVRADIRDRAIHPDVWWHQYYEETKDLTGKERREKREMWQYREKKHRG